MRILCFYASVPPVGGFGESKWGAAASRLNLAIFFLEFMFSSLLLYIQWEAKKKTLGSAGKS
jgi:hypothetical protein